MTDRNRGACQWKADLLADTAARIDAASAVLADRLLREWDDELAGLGGLLERVGRDLDRLHREHQEEAA